MRVIDLLNKIANGEDIPKRIKYNGTIYEKFGYNNKYYDIKSNSKETDILSEHLASESFYNDEIEIIEEYKKIEKLSILTFSDLLDMPKEELVDVIKEQRFKINEIIDHLNKEKE